jgi:hypothetical protein
LFATLPVTSATPEKTFSTLSRIKTYLRSTMTEKRLNGLAIENINKKKSYERSRCHSSFCSKRPKEHVVKRLDP